jgi:hypothetical protein
MTVETSLRIAVGGFVARQVPDDQSLVTAGGKKHIRANLQVSNQFTYEERPVLWFYVLLQRSGQSRDPSRVTLEGAS